MRERTSAAQSVAAPRRTTSSPASRAASSRSGGSFTPEEGLRSIKPLRPADMNRIILAVTALFFTLSLFAADAPKECTLCVGSVTELNAIPATPVPLIAKTSIDKLTETGTALDAMAPAIRAHTTLLIGYGVARDKDPLLEIEAQTKTIIDWAKLHGPFDAIGINVDGVEPAQAAYAIKRLAVMAQGQNVASRIVHFHDASDDLNKLADAGAMPYIDVLFVDANDVKSTAAW